jgi:glycerophosphoryl diester phosphodiesterase
MLIFAHRGVAYRGADENSVEAFCRAVEYGIDGVELDIRLTKDEQPVVVHDVDLRRIAGNNQKIEKLLWKDVREIKLRHGSSIPLLDEVTACVPPPKKIDFEVKDHAAVHLLIRKLHTSKNLRERSMISSFKKEVLECAEADVAEVPRLLLMRRWPVRLGKFAEWLSLHPVQGIGLDAGFWTERRCRWVRAHGAQVISWEHYGIKSTERRARRMLKLGVDIMIVNKPQVYLEIPDLRGET